MSIIVYNIKKDDFSNEKNNFYIGRPSILSNPYTHDGKKSKLAINSFKTRDEAIDAYNDYFDYMVNNNNCFKNEFDKIYDLYKNGENVYLGCFCKPLRCHGDIIKEKLQKRMINEYKKGGKK